ncbi:MAG: class II fumarate hydratase [Acidimicrobiia bacterium]
MANESLIGHHGDSRSRSRPPRPQLVRWGHNTDLAVANFPVSGSVMPMAIVRSLALIKGEAAAVNCALGTLDRARAISITEAAEEIIDGAFDDQFPVDVFQTGSGTSTNMNVNEVIAHRATERLGLEVHPNDHVNMSQSSNDTFPSAVRIAGAMSISTALLPQLRNMSEALRDLASEHDTTVKLGRTHLMDAVPMTFGQEVSGWARSMDLAADRVSDALSRLVELPIGGTAVGTGLNAPAGFGSMMAAGLAQRTGMPFVEAINHFEAQSTQDAVLEMSGAVKVAALSLHKIAGDLRLLGSGPHGGLGELRLPALQPGSSIMPGKVNPVMCEMAQQVVARIVGNDATITFGSTASTLQLNTAMPVMGVALLSSIDLLATAVSLLHTRCIAAIAVDAARMRDLADRSSALVTALAPVIGYDRAASVALAMVDRSVSLVEALASEGLHDVEIADVLDLTNVERS